MMRDVATDTSERAERSQPGRLQFFLLTLFVGVVYFLAALLGIIWTREAGSIAALWPPNAILIAVLLNASPRHWAGFSIVCLAANMTANMIFETALLFSLSLALANLLEVAACVYLIRLTVRDGEIFRDVTRFVKAFMLPAVLAPTAGALVGAAAVGFFAGAPFIAVFETWWMADALGIIIFLPLAVIVVRGVVARRAMNRLIPMPSVSAMVTFAVLTGAIAWILVQDDIFIVFILLQATFLWVVFRSGLVGCAQALAAIGVVLTYFTLEGEGPIGVIPDLTVAEKILSLQIKLAAMAIPMLLIAIVLSHERGLRKSLASSQQRYLALYDQSPVMLHSTGRDGSLVSASKFWLKRMGYSREEVLDRPLTDFLTERSKDYAISEVTPRFQRDGEITDVEYQFVTKDGEVFDALVSAIKEPDLGDQVPRSLAVVRDITEQRRSDQALAHSMAELRRSNDDLQQFAYVASHDLQEPLRMVASYCELLERRFADKLGEDGRTFIAFAVDGARRMQSLINDLLKYSRVNSQGYNLTPVNLNKVIDAVKRDLRVFIEERGAQVAVGSLPTIQADEEKIRAALQNLIHNAIKFNRSTPPKVEIKAEPDDDHWRLIVSDNGIGLDLQHAERIFDVFQRLHTRDEFPGTGIGLAIVKRTIEGHGGAVSVTGEPGHGSVFTLTMPNAGLGKD